MSDRKPERTAETTSDDMSERLKGSIQLFSKGVRYSDLPHKAEKPFLRENTAQGKSAEEAVRSLQLSFMRNVFYCFGCLSPKTCRMIFRFVLAFAKCPADCFRKYKNQVGFRCSLTAAPIIPCKLNFVCRLQKADLAVVTEEIPFPQYRL